MSEDDLELQACQLKQGQYIPDGAVKAVKATPLSSMKVRRAKSLVSVYKLLGTKNENFKLIFFAKRPGPAGKISRIPWGVSGDFGCWWRESTRKFGL